MFTTNQLRQLIAADNTDAFYNSKYWRRLSHDVIREHHNECYMCKLKGEQSRAVLTHHVLSLRKHPELAYSRFRVDEHGRSQIQLMPLCHDCHELAHGRGVHAKRKGFSNVEKW